MPVRVLCWTPNAVFPEPGWTACPKFSGLLLRKNMRGINVARLRISVWFVGNPSLGGYFPIARDPGVSGIDSHKPASVLILPSMPSPTLVRDDG